MAIRVILADDHRLIREGLKSLLDDVPDIEVIGQAGNGRMAVQLCRELGPEVMVMDITMPEMNGVEATRQLLAEMPTVKVVALSMHSDPRMVAQALKAGALGYVLKDSVFDELRLAITTVMTDRPYFSPTIAKILLEGYLSHNGEHAPASVFEILTARECEVLQLIAEGHSTRDIAEALYVSVKTVEKHRQQIMDKLGIRSIAELTRYAIREGLIPLEG